MMRHFVTLGSSLETEQTVAVDIFARRTLFPSDLGIHEILDPLRHWGEQVATVVAERLLAALRTPTHQPSVRVTTQVKLGGLLEAPRRWTAAAVLHAQLSTG